jgi:hypothetical protein
LWNGGPKRVAVQFFDEGMEFGQELCVVADGRIKFGTETAAAGVDDLEGDGEVPFFCGREGGEHGVAGEGGDPVVTDDGIEVPGIVVDDLGENGKAAEGALLLEAALAKSVDGGDGEQVEIEQGALKAGASGGGLGGGVEGGVEEAAEDGDVACRFTGEFFGGGGGGELGEHAADAIGELAGGVFGEGNEEEFGDVG